MASKKPKTGEAIYDALLNTPTHDIVTLHFKNGRRVRGHLIFDRFKGTGRVINDTEEGPTNFAVEELSDVTVKG